MFEKVKEYLNEIIEIANTCPEKYQEKCFEILLNSIIKPEIPAIKGEVGEAVISKTDFFSDHEISQKEWQRVFNFDGNVYSIIVKDLKNREKSKKQVKLALLIGVKGLLETGEALIPKELLFDSCKKYVAYDSTNFAAHMKKAKDLFLTKGDDWTLTIPGQDKAAEVIKELA